MKILSSILFGMVLLFSSAPAFATGNGSHAGTQVFVAGRWQDATLFLESRVPGQPVQLSPELSTYLDSLFQLMESYGVATEALERSFFGERAEFRFVGRKQIPCQSQEVEHLDGRGRLYGCTQGDITYLIRKRFDPRANRKNPHRLRDLAFKLIHERLHSIRASTSHEAIGRFLRGLELMVDLAEEQNAGVRRMLLGSELSILQGFVAAGLNVGLDAHYSRYRASLQVHRFGGGAIYYGNDAILAPQHPEPEIEAKAFIGVGSTIRLNRCYLRDAALDSNDRNIVATKILGRNIEVLNSRIGCGIVIQSNVRILNSDLAGWTIHWNLEYAENSLIRSQYLGRYPYPDYWVIENSTIENRKENRAGELRPRR